MGMQRFVVTRERTMVIDFTIEPAADCLKREIFPAIKPKKESQPLVKAPLPSPPKQEPKIEETKEETPIISDTSEDAIPIPSKTEERIVSNEEITESSGSDGGNNLEKDQIAEAYLSANLFYIKELIAKYLQYPQIARRMGQMGRVIVSFTVTPNGDIEEIKIKQSSGFGVLDKNAVETIKKISPLSKPPSVKVVVVIPIIYHLE